MNRERFQCFSQFFVELILPHGCFENQRNVRWNQLGNLSESENGRPGKRVVFASSINLADVNLTKSITELS